MATRVMLVDDAVVVRHILSDTLSKSDDIDVVGTAADGVLALQKLPSLRPDVVVLDVEMPNMDGIETLAAIKQQYPHIKVIMFSTLTSRGAAATMDALMLGADDYVTKPANVGSIGAAIDRINSELVPKIKALHGARRVGAPSALPAPGVATPPAVPPAAAWRPAPKAPPAPPLVPPAAVRPAPPTTRPTTPPARVVAEPSPVVAAPRPVTTKPLILAIAVSTGGPNALAALLPQLPSDLAVPVVVVQHIPPIFSKALADRLDTKSALHVAEAQNGVALKAGDVWIAPGDYHMVVRREGGAARIETNQGPPENSCRPAADVLFRSVATAYGAATLGLVLTGMGSDGAKGSEALVAAGGHVLAQDEATSVVWGMPGAVTNAGLVDRVLPLQTIAAEIVARVGTSRAPAAAGIPAARP